jgi:Ion channel
VTESPAKTPPRRSSFGIVAQIDSYRAVLILILLTYVLSVTLTQSWGGSVVIVVQIATVWIILRISEAPRSIRAVAAVSLVVAIAAAALAPLFHEDAAARFLPAVSSLLYLIAPVSVVRHLVRRTVIDEETMMGAVAAYLLIGMFFAFVYRAAGANEVSAFFGAQGDGTFDQDLFFSFTTLTTTGYGNLVPAANPGESFATAEMLMGQLFLVTAVAKVVSSYRPTKQRARVIQHEISQEVQTDRLSDVP